LDSLGEVTILPEDVDLKKDEMYKEQREYSWPVCKFVPPKLFMVPNLEEIKVMMAKITKVAGGDQKKKT